MSKWLIVLCSFVLAGVMAQYSATRAPWPEVGLPVMALANGESVTRTSSSRPPAGRAHVVNCFSGTGQIQPPTPAPYPPRVYLPLIVKPAGLTACSGVELEPNDTHVHAAPFEQSCYAGTTAWSGDLDWYQINLCAAAPGLRLSLTGPPSADLDLYLYGNPPGNPLGASEGTGSQELIATGPLVTGTYFVLVSPVSGSGSYTVTGALAAP
jgi:hypothetical protein